MLSQTDRAKKAREWYKTHKEKAAEYGKRWKTKNREKDLLARKKWRKENPDYQKEWAKKHPERRKRLSRKHILKNYNLTTEEYDALLKAQEGRCAFPNCTATEYRKGRKDSLAVDHNHLTGEVRGLLCYRHNILIGLAKDSVHELRAAVAYLERKK